MQSNIYYTNLKFAKTIKKKNYGYTNNVLRTLDND